MLTVALKLSRLFVLESKPELLVIPFLVRLAYPPLLLEEQCAHRFTFTACTFAQSGLSLLLRLFSLLLEISGKLLHIPASCRCKTPENLIGQRLRGGAQRIFEQL